MTISKLPFGKAHRQDGLPYEVLVDVHWSDEGYLLLLTAFYKYLDTEEFHRERKLTRLALVYKGTGKPMKIDEKRLADNRFGFKANKSTENSIRVVLDVTD